MGYKWSPDEYNFSRKSPKKHIFKALNLDENSLSRENTTVPLTD